MKKIFMIFLISFILILSACSSKNLPSDVEGNITDYSGKTVMLKKDARIVSAYASFTECWLLSGGTLVGVTSDAIDERNLAFDNGVEIIGTVKEINLEKVVALNPDYIILSQDITAHHELKNSLDAMGIDYGFFAIDSFDDYDKIMQMFCKVNGREDLYNENVVKVKEKIDAIKKRVPSDTGKTFLLMRAYSTGIKVKSDNICEEIINDLGGVAITEKSPSLLNNLSVEELIKEDPEYIFVLTMGDEKKAFEYLSNNVESNPAWSELRAVKEGKYIILPKDLFHYKPNNKWGDSYEYLAKILYPEIFG